MNRTAIFPGSFDPMTIGHLALLRRATKLFDKVIVAVGINSDKKSFMPVEERLERIRRAVAEMENVEVTSYTGLTTDLCREVGAGYILRGVRNALDYEYERNIADINRHIAPEIETVLLFAEPEYAAISSSMVRELARFGKDCECLIA